MFIDYNKSTEIIVNLEELSTNLKKSAAWIDHMIMEIKKETGE